MTVDTRTLNGPVYTALNTLYNTTKADYQKKSEDPDRHLKDQKNQAVQLYTYLATWGMMRLKAEEKAISDSQPGRKEVVREYFKCLQTLFIGFSKEATTLEEPQGLQTLCEMETDDYLGLTGLGLALAQEFSFWANAIYHDVTGDQ